MIQLFALFFTLIGAIFSVIAGIKSLIPDYQYKFRAIYYGLINPNNNLKKLTNHLIDELNQSNHNSITINHVLTSKLEELRDSNDRSNNNLKSELGDIFDESRLNATLNLWLLLSIISISIAMILQAIAIYQNIISQQCITA